METVHLTIEGMSCGHCVAAVRRALESVPGARVDDVGIGSADVTLTSDDADPAALVDAVDDEGYTATVRPSRR